MSPASTVRKSLLIILLITVVVLALILATLSTTVPVIAKHYLSNYDIDLTIGELDINLLNAGFVINNISIADITSEQKLTIASVEIEIALREMINNKVFFVEQFDIRNANIPVVKKEGQYWLAGIDLERFNNSEPKASENETTAEQSQPLPTFGWQELSLTDIAIRYTDEDILNTNSKSQAVNSEKVSAVNTIDAIDLTVTQLSIGPLHSTLPKEKTPLQAEFRLLDAQLTFAGDISPLDKGRQGHLSTSLKTVDIARFLALAKSQAMEIPEPVSQLAGELAYQGRIDWWLTEQRIFVNALASDLTIVDLALSLDKPSQMDPKNGAPNRTEADQSLGGKIQLLAEEIKFAVNPLSIKATQLELISPDFYYRDNNLEPAVSIDLSQLSITVDQYDNAVKAKNQPSAIALKTKMGEFGSLEGLFQLALNDIKQTGTVSLEGEQINLSQFSGFAASAIGKKIDKGALDFTLDANINAGMIDSELKLEAHQFSLKKAKSPKKTGETQIANQSGGFESELGMPINTALNLLRDKDDTVRLSIPVNGPVDDPKIRLNRIVNKALFKALKTAVMTQVGPLMALSALDKVQSLRDAAKLKPVVYAPLEEQLPEDQIASVDKLVTFMNKREKIKINICGRASNKEFLSAQQQESLSDEPISLSEQQQTDLTELANNRAVAIKRYFIDHGVDGKRLILCAAEIDDSNSAKPRVDFSL